jgi:hypothetical protein
VICKTSRRGENPSALAGLGRTTGISETLELEPNGRDVLRASWRRRENTFPRRDASEFFHQITPMESEGAGKTGHRLVPMVRVQKKARGRTTGSAEDTRPSLRNGFTAYTRSPR